MPDQNATRARNRVLWLCLEWPSELEHRGGVARYAYRLAQQLAGVVDLTVVTEEGGIPLLGVEMLYLPKSKGRFDRFYLQPIRLRRIVKRFKPQIVHAFGDDWALPSGDWGWVRTFLGSAKSEARSSSGLRRWNHNVLSLLEHISKRRTDVRVAIGPDSAKEFSCEYIMPPVVNVERVGLAKSDIPSVVFVGSYLGRKRGEWVERALGKSARRLGREVSLTVFGPASDSANWGKSVHHVAGASDETVHNSIEAAWLLVSPSRYEGFGIPIFEGLALGTRVVATSNPGSDYQASLLPRTGVLRVVDTESEFFDAVCCALNGSAELTPDEAAAAEVAVGRMVSEGSARFLLDHIYPSVLMKTADGG